jgi:hypothetical protein
MDAFQENAGYNGELVDQAFVILSNNDDQHSIEQATIIQGAVETICNHIGGVNGLTQVECHILIKFTGEIMAAEQLPFLDAQANVFRTARPEGSMTGADIKFLDFATDVADSVAAAQMAAAGFSNPQAQDVNQGLIPFDGNHQDRVAGTEFMTATSATHTDEAGTSSHHSIISKVLSPSGTTMSTSSFTMTSSVTPGMFPALNIPMHIQGDFVPLDVENMAQEVQVMPQGFVLESVDFDVPAIEQAIEFDAMNAPQRLAFEGVDADASEAQQAMEVEQAARYAYLDGDGMF